MAGGAAGILAFPRTLFMRGARLRRELMFRRFARIAEAVGLPMVEFQSPPGIRSGYSSGILGRLSEIPQPVGVKG